MSMLNKDYFFLAVSLAWPFAQSGQSSFASVTGGVGGEDPCLLASRMWGPTVQDSHLYGEQVDSWSASISLSSRRQSALPNIWLALCTLFIGSLSSFSETATVVHWWRP